MKFGETNSNPTVDSGRAKSVTFGDIEISQFTDGVIWIENGDEAGSFNESDFIKHIQSFFDARF